MRGLLANTIAISLSFFCFLVIASDYLLCATTDLSLYYIALALSAYSFSFYCCASGFCLSLYLVSSASSNQKPAGVSKSHDPVTSLSLINHRRACAARVTVLGLCTCVCVRVRRSILAPRAITRDTYERLQRHMGSKNKKAFCSLES